jgi:hypothetical protein
MGLIKKKDAESYFATKRSKQLLSIVPASKPDPITNLNTEGSAGVADDVEAQRSELLMAEKSSSQTTGTRHSKIALVHPAKKSVGV